VQLAFYRHLFETFAFVFGAVVGSFLNVCIYRMPIGLSVNEPKRSFCPQCKTQIPWSQNLPLISWLALRGKCATCGKKISFGYFGIELLTAVAFLAIWWKAFNADEWILVFPYWILAGLLIVATFIDFEHFIIPDEITWGGVVAGILLSFAIPPLMDTDSHLTAGLLSILGAATGYLLLWGVVDMGKIAFGKKKIILEAAQPFSWERAGEEAVLQVGEERSEWSEMFSRPKDRLILKCPEATIGQRRFENVTLVFCFDKLFIAGKEFSLDALKEVRGTVTELVIPREAMGFGDVKFIAAIGAFLGWQAVLFTVVSASMIGAIVGLVTIGIGRRAWSAKIPFGPYLALGAVIWLFAGWIIIHWYLGLLPPTQPFPLQ
jgi:leader peptidase (prepilin peptidase)/N-methyltransferase